MTLVDAKNWCEQKTSIPDDFDEVFTAKFHASSITDDDKFLHIFATTKILLFALHNELLSTDGTYKLTYQDYPILVFGRWYKVNCQFQFYQFF